MMGEAESEIGCKNPKCESCYPKVRGKPLWHGWMTVEDARNIMREMQEFIEKCKAGKNESHI